VTFFEILSKLCIFGLAAFSQLSLGDVAEFDPDRVQAKARSAVEFWAVFLQRKAMLRALELLDGLFDACAAAEELNPGRHKGAFVRGDVEAAGGSI
jgi:hypothetical protein